MYGCIVYFTDTMAGTYNWVTLEKDRYGVDHVNEYAFVTLTEAGEIIWGYSKSPCGTWHYHWSNGEGLMLMEFSAGKKKLKRHILEQVDDTSYVLLHYDGRYYEAGALTGVEKWSKDSVPHYNKCKVFMQKLQMSACVQKYVEQLVI